MARRRAARRDHRRRNWAIAAAAALLALFIAYGTWPVIAVAVIAATVYTARRWHRSTQAAIADSQTARPVATPRPRPAAADTRARRNGWAPPARATLTDIPVTRECASDEHVTCPGAGCACPCGHDPRVIVAMNTARYAASRPAADSTPPPF